MKALKFIVFAAVLASGVSAFACDRFPQARNQSALTEQPEQTRAARYLAMLNRNGQPQQDQSTNSQTVR
jgi:hypothetical protein